jgi:hypothetical protein
MEEMLCSIERFNQLDQLKDKLLTRNTMLAKAYAMVTHVRQLAFRQVAQNPHHHMTMREYYVALFYQAINSIRYTDLSPVQRKHALLSASLLSDRLDMR